MPDPAEPGELDLSRIEFPTDRITVRQLRNWQPRFFDVRLDDPRLIESIHVVSTMWLEQGLAARAFAGGAGLPDPSFESLIDRNAAVQVLNEDYVRYGLSSGLEQTRQLIREFETQAVQQGKAARGLSR